MMAVGLGLFAWYHTTGGLEHLAENNYNGLLPEFVAREFPHGFAGLFAAALMAAVISTVDSGMNCLATVTMTDFQLRFRKSPLSDAGSIFYARLWTVVWAALCIGLAFFIYVSAYDNIARVSGQVIGLFSGSILGIFLLGMLVPRVNAPGAGIGGGRGRRGCDLGELLLGQAGSGREHPACLLYGSDHARRADYARRRSPDELLFRAAAPRAAPGTEYLASDRTRTQSHRQKGRTMKNVFLSTAVFTLSLVLTGAEVRLLADRSDPGPVTGIAVQEGRIFASGGLGEPLQELDGTGAVRRAWGRKFIADKHGLRSSGGYLYATDIGNHQVFKMTADGEVVMTLGEKGVPGCDETHFNKPTDVAVAPDGDIYVTDGYGNRRVACFGPDGRFKFAWGKEGGGPGEFKNPHNIVIGSDNRVYVADRDNRRLQIFDRKGVCSKSAPTRDRLFGLDTDGERLF